MANIKKWVLLILPVLLSCQKNKEETRVPFSTASYHVIVTLNWSLPAFGVPAGAHVTDLIGMIHTNDASLWTPGLPATPGLEDVAEIGNKSKMEAELDAIILQKKALSRFVISPPPVTGTIEANLVLNTDYPTVSFASMVAPSPDWFTGLSGCTLLKDNLWLDDITMNLLVYDAGTEDGDRFGYDNPVTMPQQNIQLLSVDKGSVLANGNPSIAPIGTVRFVKN